MLGEASTPPRALGRNMRAMWLFILFNATTWMIGLGTPMVLLAGELGARPSRCS